MALSLANPAFAQTPAKSPKPADAIFGEDKVRHFFIAGFVESLALAAAEGAGARRGTAKTVAIGVTAAVSIGRELHDRRTKGLFSVRDLMWDALGAAAAMLVLAHTQR